jgi:hypothetical protein
MSALLGDKQIPSGGSRQPNGREIKRLLAADTGAQWTPFGPLGAVSASSAGLLQSFRLL